MLIGLVNRFMEDTIGSILADTSRLIRRAFDEGARTIGVTRPQWQVLSVLRRHEGSNQGKLADLMDVEPITLCRMVDRMQEAELVERRRDPADRRVWRLYLTDKAIDLLDELLPIGEDVMNTALNGMSNKEQALLHELLDKVRQNLARHTVDTEQS